MRKSEKYSEIEREGKSEKGRISHTLMLQLCMINSYFICFPHYRSVLRCKYVKFKTFKGFIYTPRFEVKFRIAYLHPKLTMVFET